MLSESVLWLVNFTIIQLVQVKNGTGKWGENGTSKMAKMKNWQKLNIGSKVLLNYF